MNPFKKPERISRMGIVHFVIFGVLLCVISLLIVLHNRAGMESSPHYQKEVSQVSAPFDTSKWQSCNNPEGKYSFKFPNDWYTYGEGSTGNDMILIGTTTCMGFGVTVSNNPPIPGFVQSYGQSLNVRVDLEGDALQHQYMKQGLADITKGGPVSSQDIIKAFAGTTTVQWITVDGLKFAQIGPNNDPVMVIGITNNNLYSITPDNISLDMLQTILATFRFGTPQPSDN